MATNTNNVITRGFRGKIGNLIFRMWGKKTVVSSAPSYKTLKWSKAQKENRRRFHDAMTWARQAMEDPEKRLYYQKKAKKMQTPWNVAVADFMKKPEIREIEVRNYHGKTGDTIEVKVWDKYMVAGVIVSIYDNRGVEVESGLAVETLTPFVRIYQSMEDNSNWKGGHVEVRVSDFPGNVTKSSLVL